LADCESAKQDRHREFQGVIPNRAHHDVAV